MLTYAALNKIQTLGAVVQWGENFYGFVKHEQQQQKDLCVSYWRSSF